MTKYLRQTWKKQAIALALGSCFAVTSALGFAAPLELTLDDSIKMALNNNPAIKIAESDRVSAEWKIDEAQGAKGLTGSYAHTGTHLKTASSKATVWPGGVKTEVPVPSTEMDKFDNKVTLSLPLYTGGKVEGVIDQAKLGLTIADLGVQKSRQQVKLDATTAYLNVLQAQNMLKLSQESVDRLNAHLKNVQAQYSVGTVAKVDVLRSEVEAANAEQNLIKAQNALDLSVASLNNVLGLSLDTEVSLKDNLQYDAYSQSIEDCIKYALEQRPEVLQAKSGREVADLGIKVAKSGNLPTVGLQAYTDWNKDKFPGMDNKNWAVTVAASWNFFDSGVTKSKVKQADASLLKADEQLRQVKDLVQLDVRQSYLSLREAEKRIATSKVAVDKAEEDYKISQVRYTSGVGTNIDVIDAQVALTQAKTNYVQALYDYNASKAKLDKAMGIQIN